MNDTPAVNDAPAPAKKRRRKSGTNGRLYRRPNSAFWWLAITNNHGRVKRESTGETNRRQAEDKLRAKRDLYGAERIGKAVVPDSEVKKRTVKSLLDALLAKLELKGVKSLKQIRSHVGHIERAFGNWPVLDLTEDAIQHYVAARVKKGHAPASINHSLQLLGQAITGFLMKNGFPVPPIEKLPVRNAREGYYSKAEAEALLAALPEDLRDFVLWSWLTGWRKGEQASLRWEFVDRENRSIRLSWRSAKTPQARTMALTGELAAIVDRRWQARKVPLRSGTSKLSEFVFHRGEGEGQHAGQIAPVRDFDKAFETACEKAGITYGRFGGRTLHCFRRTGARNLRNAGVPENVIMQITGHKTRSMFDRYAIVNEHDVAEAMDKVQAHLAALPSVPSNVTPLKVTQQG
jgi:integrase